VQGGNVAHVQQVLPPPSPPPSPPPANPLFIPTIPSDFSGRIGSSNGSSSSGGSGGGGSGANRSRPAVQLGPGQTSESLARDITAGRYIASDLDK
jgi:hypothetical protein